MIHSSEFITPFPDSACVQPNATDVRIDQLFTLTGRLFALSENQTTHRGNTPIPSFGEDPVAYDWNSLNNVTVGGRTPGFDESTQQWILGSGSYPFLSSMYVEIPTGVAGIVVPRSSLVRNGLLLASGLWDSGFKGYLGGTLHVPQGCICVIARGARIGQFVTWASETRGTYAGGYNQEKSSE